MNLQAVFPTILLIAATWACGGGGSARANNSPSGEALWEKVGLPSAATQLNHIAFNSTGHWFIADRSQGFFRSTDQGASWTRINTGLATPSGWTIDINPVKGDLVAATYPGVNGTNPIRFYRSTDEGSHWAAVSTSFSLSAYPAFTGCVFAPNGNAICGGFWSPAPYSGAWVSANGGQTTVAALTSPLIGGVFGFGYNPVSKDLWLGNETHGVFRSTDNGFTWMQESPPDQAVDPVHGIRDGNARAFAFDSNGNVLFAAQGGIWKSSKSGSSYTWTNVMANGNTSAGKSLGQDGSGNLYYGHDVDTTNPTTIYRSTDNGTTWAPYDSGVPQLQEATQFLVNPVDRKMYVYIENEATNVGTLYRTVNPVQ